MILIVSSRKFHPAKGSHSGSINNKGRTFLSERRDDLGWAQLACFHYPSLLQGTSCGRSPWHQPSCSLLHPHFFASISFEKPRADHWVRTLIYGISSRNTLAPRVFLPIACCWYSASPFIANPAVPSQDRQNDPASKQEGSREEKFQG